MRIKCLKTVESGGRVYFEKGREYSAAYDGDTLFASDNSGERVNIAVRLQRDWENDSWFKEHFKIG